MYVCMCTCIREPAKGSESSDAMPAAITYANFQVMFARENGIWCNEQCCD